MNRYVRQIGFVSAATALGLLSACTSKTANATAAAGAIAVTSTETECQLSAAQAPSGNISFEVKNTGSQVTEFYLLAEDGLRILGEVENIGPGLSRRLIVTTKPGSYLAACKPGMVGAGIRTPFTVTDSGVSVQLTGELADELNAATTQYAAYVRDQTDQLLSATQSFAALYTAGKDDEARRSYAPTRMFWERIEPVAESFGDLDPKLDLREADLEPQQIWTGWHRIEKDLWPPAGGAYVPATPQERTALAEQLVADTTDLHARVATIEFTPDQLGNGAKELLDEVATGKVTGEEEIWSSTDLWDFQANIDGARIAFEVLEPVVTAKDAALATSLTTRFDAVQQLLDGHRDGEGFVLYKSLTPAQVKALADAVNALAEPLSKLTAVVVS